MTESTDTVTNLQPVPISNHDSSVFDELSHRCDAGIHSSTSSQQQKRQSTIGINNFHSSYLMPTTTMNDYERRFQRSLQKLTIPSWYTDTIRSSNVSSSSKQSIISTPPIPGNTQYRERQRTPEIIHVRRPHSYRSCRSSIATSPSPSVHSWHPNHMMDGGNFSLLIPSSSFSSSRRYTKYQKGIERVSKSSRWYQPTQFITNKPIKDQTGVIKISTSSKTNHYDTPKIHNNDENVILKLNNDVEKTIVNEQNNNMTTNDKEQDNHIKSNESQIMPLANIKEPFNQIGLEDDNKQIVSLEQIEHNKLLERAANDLVESVLADILLLKNLYDEDDQNSGVRELSDDENGLRELDENDMTDTDEFIVFGANVETTFDDNQISNIPRYNLNKLYTFSKPNDSNVDNFKQINSNQNSPRSIFEKNVVTTNSITEQPFNKLFYTSPIDHSHFQDQNINFNKYIDSMTCPLNSQSSTCQSSEGVNEETARIGRLLLDSIPIPFIENISNLSQTPPSARSISRNTRFVVSDRDDYQRRILEEYDEELNDKVRRDSAYSSNQERIHIQQSTYEPLSECYSGYSFIQSDFLTPNISSIQSTTDEAYESEPTTMCSSIATTTYVHPYLEHEFEYPSPPPPVPDRRLKPAYLKSSPPPTKPRLSKQDNNDSIGYSIIQKTKPLVAIQQFLTSTSNDSTSPSTRTMSSRHYCGSIPVSNEVTKSSINATSIKINEQLKDKPKEKRTNRTLNCLHPSTTDDDYKPNLITKSSSFNKMKIKKQKLITDIDEVTNGLAIRLPAPISNGYDLTNKPNPNRTSTPLSTKRSNIMTKNRQTSDNIKQNRSPFYETSV